MEGEDEVLTAETRRARRREMEAGRGGRMGGSCPARREVGQAVGWQGRVSRRAQVDASAHELPIGLVGEAKASPAGSGFPLTPALSPQAGRGGFLACPMAFSWSPHPGPLPQAGEGDSWAISFGLRCFSLHLSRLRRLIEWTANVPPRPACGEPRRSRDPRRVKAVSVSGRRGGG